MARCIISCAIILLSWRAFATDYYVSNSGSDVNSGASASQAWKTLSKVAHYPFFAAGDRILFERGSSWSGTALTFSDSGTTISPITLSSYGSGDMPLFQNIGQLNVLKITGSNVVVENLRFQNCATFTSFGTSEYQNSGAVVVASGADNVTVQKCEFAGVGVGVKSYGFATIVSNDYFHDLIISYQDTVQSYGAIGVSINNSKARISCNRFINCRSTNSPYGADGGAIEIEGLLFQKNNLEIDHNLSIGSQGFIEATETSATNVRIHHNISDDYQQFLAWDTTHTPADYTVDNNTIIRTHSENAVAVFCVFYYRTNGPSPDSTWLTFRNNIFYCPAAKILKGSYSYEYYDYPHSYNLSFDGTADPVGYPLGVGDLVADPMFVNLSAQDYHVLVSSPAIDAGINLGYDVDSDGNAIPTSGPVDMGAYQAGPPLISVNPENQIVAAGSNATLTVVATGTTPLNYQWWNCSGPVVGATNATLSFTPAQTNDWDSYAVVVTNLIGSVTSTWAALTVYEPVSIVAEPSSLVLPYGASASFGILAEGFPSPSYQWFLNRTNLSGATSNKWTISHVQMADLGEYEVLVSNGYSSVFSSPATLSMSPSILEPFRGLIGTWGERAILSVEAVGSGILNYQWYKDGDPLSSGTNAMYMFNSLQLTDGGLYSVMVSSAFGSVTNSPAQLALNAADISLGKFAESQGTFAGVTIHGVAGYTYGIQYSTNLTDTGSWMTITNVTLQQPDDIWVDTSVDLRQTPQRYYRVKAVQ